MILLTHSKLKYESYDLNVLFRRSSGYENYDLIIDKIYTPLWRFDWNGPKNKILGALWDEFEKDDEYE